LISDDDIIKYTDMYKKRSISTKLIRLFNTFPSVVVCGARQVGKSTLIKRLYPDFEYILFDPAKDFDNAKKDSDMFLSNHPTPLLLDEIQYAPELVSSIKRRIDMNKKPGMYLLTGSQQWSVMKALSDSLAGRIIILTLEGFSLSEIYQQEPEQSWLERWLVNPDNLIQNRPKRMNVQRTLYEQLWRGWLPEADVLPSDAITEFYEAYVRTYIERDVRVFMDVSDLREFGRFLQLVCALSAREINQSQIGRDIGITPQTAKRWLSILSATFQWFWVPPYHSNSIKRISGKYKGYMADTGVICAQQMIFSPQTLSSHPMVGFLFETAVFSEIRKLSYSISGQPGIYHWRTFGGAEVDFILERDGILFPIEVKLTSHPNRSDTTGITAFRKTYPNLRIAPGLVIAPCDRFEQISDNDYCLPWDTI
jgi:predicted AAA+ superfamily ATPase